MGEQSLSKTKKEPHFMQKRITECKEKGTTHAINKQKRNRVSLVIALNSQKYNYHMAIYFSFRIIIPHTQMFFHRTPFNLLYITQLDYPLHLSFLPDSVPTHWHSLNILWKTLTTPKILSHIMQEEFPLTHRTPIRETFPKQLLSKQAPVPSCHP